MPLYSIALPGLAVSKRLALADNRQIITAGHAADADSRQVLSALLAWNADTLQFITNAHQVDGDTKQIIFAAHVADADTEQIIHTAYEAFADFLAKIRSYGFWFNNDHIWDHDGDLLTESVIDGIPETKEITLDVPGRPGVYYFGTEDGERVFRPRLRFDIPTTHEAKRLELAAWLTSRIGEVELKLDAEPDKVYYMRVSRKWQFPGTPLRVEFDVEFRGSDPYAYGNQVTNSTTGTSPRALSLVNPGTIEAPMVITLTPAAGAITAVTLTLGTQTMTISGPFTQALTIDTAGITAITGGANAAGQIGGDWITLPSGNSELNISWTGGDMTVNIAFRPSWQ